MSGIEAAALTLSAAVVKSAAKLWLGDRVVAADVTASAIDILSAKTGSLIERRRVPRAFDELVDTVAKKLTPFIEVEFASIPENETQAAIYAVSTTFERASLADNYLYSTDLNAAYIDRYLRSQSPTITEDSLLSEPGTGLYSLLLRESCEYLVQVTLALPKYQVGAVTELLRRTTEIISDLRQILDRLPEQSDSIGSDTFSVDYRRQVTNQLDRMELFGATLSEASRRYPLSVAYISLNLSADTSSDSSASPNKSGLQDNTFNVDPEHVLAMSKRILIRGEAGSGKTTLLKWIAVRTSLREFPQQLEPWNDSVPFFIPLRRYVDAELPSIKHFPEAVGRFIAQEMPPGWVADNLRSGRATVLVDGLDEFPENKRDAARAWLNDLISAFPDARYVVTSRPAAVAPGWLDVEGFKEFELLPMTLSDIRAFVIHWHDAMRSVISDADEVENLNDYQQRLIGRITGRRHLRAIAETPLLCALLCALHYDRRGQLPNNRMELYDVALDMLLERRDAEHHVVADMTLSRTEKTLLLQDIAYWLIRNGWSDAPREKVVEHIRHKLTYMSQISATPESVYRHLVERSGLIREPVADRVDFVHRTFQEYLAALEVLTADDIGLLVQHAHMDEWREVVIMAVGHAYAPKREQILQELVSRGDSDPTHRDELHLLAVACLETSPELSIDLRSEIRARVEGLLPPKNLTAAKSLASAGDFVVDLLAQARPRLAREAAATVRAAAQIGTESALRVIQGYRRDRRETVFKELLQAWPEFDVEEYAITVLSDSPLASRGIGVSSPDVLPALRLLPGLKELYINVRGEVNLNYLRELEELEALAIYGGRLTNANALGDLVNLTSLTLPGANIEDLQPLSNLTNLRVCQIASTKAEDLTPLGDLGRLQILDIDGTNVTDLSPLSSLVNLVKLDIQSTDVSNLSPLAGLKKLDSIQCLDSKVENLAPLSGLLDLSHLDITRTLVTNLSPLEDLVKLSMLFASYTNVSDLSALSKLTKLHAIHLQGTNVQDLTPLRDLSDLRYLDLRRTKVSDLGPLAGLKMLEQLYLSQTAVEDISALVEAPNLRDIYLEDTQVRDLRPLKRSRRLRRLILRNTPVEDLSPLSDLLRLYFLDVSETRVETLDPLLPLSGTLRLITIDRDLRPMVPPELARSTRISMRFRPARSLES